MNQAEPAELTETQYATVYNVLSLALAALLFTALSLLVSQRRIHPAYRNAVIVSAIVRSIAAHHYFKIFNNLTEAYPRLRRSTRRTPCRASASTGGAAASTGS